MIEVICQQIDVLVQPIPVVPLDIQADLFMQQCARRKRKGVIGDFAGEDMLEKVCQLGIGRIQRCKFQRTQRFQLTAHAILGAQMIIDAPQHRSLEEPADDACYFQEGLLILSQLVDAAQDQAGKAGRQFDLLERLTLLRVDAPIMQVVQQLFDVERIALGSSR